MKFTLTLNTNNYESCYFFVFLSFLFSKENQTIDGVAAIIEEYIVLKSDLAQMVNMSLIQNKIDPEKEPEKFLSLQSSVLQSMVDQKIILKKAEFRLCCCGRKRS